MFCQKEEIDHVLGNHKGARDHLVSTEWTTGKQVDRSSFSEYNNVFGFVFLLFAAIFNWIFTFHLSGQEAFFVGFLKTCLFWMLTQLRGWAAM